MATAGPGALADRIDAVLPQTQCTRCGYPDCRAYAEAIAAGEADIDRCPPGGAEGIARLAHVTGRPIRPLDPACGTEGPLVRVRIDEATCIGCTLCIQACPVDCIVGSPKALHAVLEDDCTGCGLCVPVCPVDCIHGHPVDPARHGWAAWSPAQADAARQAYAARQARRVRQAEERRQERVHKAERKLADLDAHTRALDPAEDRALAPADAQAERARRRAVVEAALARARAAAGR